MITTNKRAVKKRVLSGMSLIELMLTLAILSIVLAVAMSLLSSILNVSNVSNRTLQDERNTRAALLQVTRAIHQFDLALDDNLLDDGSAFAVGDNLLTLGQQFDFRLGTDNTLVNRVSGLTIADNIEVFASRLVDRTGTDATGDAAQYFEVTIQGENGMAVTTKVKFIRG